VCAAEINDEVSAEGADRSCAFFDIRHT
jgi:hypothetical protein